MTGGGGGFGKGIAAEFVKQGGRVIIADMAEEVGAKTASELGCEFVRADVTKKQDWEALVKFADDKFGRLDVVVNNAGTTYRNKVCFFYRMGGVGRCRQQVFATISNSADFNDWLQ